MILFLLAQIFSATLLYSTDFGTDLKSKIEKEQKSLLEAEVKKRGVLGTLYSIHQKSQKIDEDVRAIETKLVDAKAQAETSAKETLRLSNIQKRLKVRLAKRLKAMYKMDLATVGNIVSSSKSSSEVGQNMKFMSLVAAKDAELIKQYRRSIDDLFRSRKRFNVQVAAFEKLQSELSKELAKLAIEKENQNLILKQVEQDRNRHMQALKEWRDAGVALEKRMKDLGEAESLPKSLSAGAIFEQKGRLKPPLIGPILEKYGLILNKKFKTKIFHKGIFIGGPVGVDVSAIFHGTVAFVGWLTGYGETIILDHGDQYYSLYAHNSKVLKQKGERVLPGEAIAKVGDTASLKGSGVYMELRHFSESLDPQGWLDLSHSTPLR